MYVSSTKLKYLHLLTFILHIDTMKQADFPIKVKYELAFPL